ncbi:MAG: ABC transporter ATP-binding protein, partial [Nitrospirales bacterium]
NLSFDLSEGEILGMIGPNGAGKTTAFNMVSGVYRPDSGSIVFDGHDITKMRPDHICKLGLTRTFQVVKPFPEITVLDNVMVGAYNRLGSERVALNKSLEILEFMGIDRWTDQLAGGLPVAGRKKLEIARALATEPRLILLDEPAAGLNIKETRDLGEIIRKIREELKITIVLVEHDMELVMRISDSITVLNFGEVIADGTPLEIQKNPEVIIAYLGEEEETQKGYNAHP